MQNRQIVRKILAQVLPEGCKLLSEPVFEPEEEVLFCNESNMEIRGARRKEWAQVSEWIPIMLEICQDSFRRAKQEV